MAVRWSSEFYTAMEHRDLQANAMAVDTSGTYVLLAGRRYIAVKNLDDTDLDNVKKFPRQGKYDVNAAEWNPTSYHNELCVISSNQRLEVLTWYQGELNQLNSLKAHTRVITDLNWHQFEPNLLASCSVDTFIHIWDMRDPRRPIVSLSAIAEASQVRWNRVSNYLLATAHDGDVKLWDQRKGTAPVQYIAAHLSKIHGLDWHPEIETQLATSSQDNTIKFFDINNPRRAEFVLNTSAPVWRARYTPFGNGMVTVVVPQLRRGENSLLLWNTANRTTPAHTFIGHRDVVLDFEWRKKRPGETDFQLVTWSRDQTLLVWRIEPFLQKLCGYDPDNRRKESARSLDIGRHKTVQKIQPLQQEFSLLNVQIPNLEVVEMNITKRSCIVKAHAASSTLVLNITFPGAYPNGVAPIFQIGQESNVEESISTQILHTVINTAQQRVSKNRTCLEPCLRQFVSTLEQFVDPSDEHPHPHTYLESDVLGSFNDACVPFPRTSGAKFCSVSTLVCFERRASMHRNSLKDATTPRALSAMGNAFNTRRASESMTVFSFYMQKQRLRFSKNNRLMQRCMVTVYDAAGLFCFSKALGAKYILDGEISRICVHNAKIAEGVGRIDLVQAWMLTNLIINAYQNDHEDMCEHPFGNQLVQSLISHYATNLDVQTAAMLSCVFGKAQDDALSKKSTLKNISGQLASGKKWLKTGTSPYHTIPPADVVADGWVVPFLRTTRSSSLDNLRIEKLSTPLLPVKSQNSSFYEYYKVAYAEMLHRWGLLYNRAEVLKYMCTPAEIHRGVEFVTDCQKCKQPARGSSCYTCKRISLECVICHVSVKGSANCCLICGHGGHTLHMQKWFDRNFVCPSGCGCRCLTETTGMFSY